jgi:hypothetical protein
VAIDGFPALAESFVAFVEGSGAMPRDQLVRGLERHVVELYRGALDLRMPTKVQQPKPPGALTNDAAAALQRRLSAQLGEFDLYRFAFDPYDPSDSDPVVGSLADDVADICRDLKDGLLAFNANEVDDAVWQWTFSFEAHWGLHAASALLAMRALNDRLGEHS